MLIHYTSLNLNNLIVIKKALFINYKLYYWLYKIRGLYDIHILQKKKEKK